MKICTSCYYVGEPKAARGIFSYFSSAVLLLAFIGSLLMWLYLQTNIFLAVSDWSKLFGWLTIILLSMLVLNEILNAGKKSGCEKCGNTDLIPEDSPRGKTLMEQMPKSAVVEKPSVNDDKEK